MMTHDYSVWYQKTFPELSGFGLWLRGGELNTLPRAEFDQRQFRVLITRLSTWRDTAESFTHKLLYQIASRIDGVYPDLAYLPPPKDAALFDRDDVPWLLGTGSKRTGADFTVIAFSLSIVQELINVPAMLRKSGIPLSKKERMADPSCPLVILGGASALFSSILFTNDPMVDGIFLGEDARVIADLFRLCKDSYSKKLSKSEILEKLMGIPGFFTPDGALHAKIYQAPTLAPEQLLESGPVMNDETCIGKADLQISEGCAHLCNFCAESFVRKPYREFDPAALHDAALRLKAFMGVDDLNLYSFNFSMHRDFYRIITDLSEIFPTIGLKSQRFDAIARDPELLAFLHAVGKTSITCGMEGISPRLRNYLNKRLDDQELYKSLSALFSAPLRELKIFLVATGLERQDDFDEFRKMLSFVQTLAAGREKPPRIIFSMTVLVRFPWTPLEFEDAPDPALCETVLHKTGQAVRSAGFEFRSASDASDYWLSQLLVRADDPRTAAALWLAQEKTGFIFYRDIPSTFITAVRNALQQQGMAPDLLLKGHALAQRRQKPWHDLETGIDVQFLETQWEAAKKYRDAALCAKDGDSSSHASCAGEPAARPVLRPLSIDRFRARLRAAQEQTVELHFSICVETALAGVPHKIRGVALARALMLADRSLTKGYRGFRRSALFTRFGSDWTVGDDCITLAWDLETAEALRSRLSDASYCKAINAMLVGHEQVAGLRTTDQVEIKTVLFRSPFRFDPSAYCKNRSLNFTLKKNGTNNYAYVLSKESLKKRIFSACVAEQQPNGQWLVSISPGPKFTSEEFARAAFKITSENQWVMIDIMGKA
jgi:radical SAM superfamily enzyme YgiQ (UPF0313 family)